MRHADTDTQRTDDCWLPRTGDEWLSTRPRAEQRAEYDRRAAEDFAEARRLYANSPRVVRWYKTYLALSRARYGESADWPGKYDGIARLSAAL